MEMTGEDIRLAILALLEAGPQRVKALAQWLSMRRDHVREELRQLRAAGQVRQDEVTRCWALVPAAMQKGPSNEQDRTREHESLLGDVRTVLERRPDAVPAVQGPGADEHVSPVRDGGIRTLVIGGIEYDALSVGSAPVTGDYASGSPLNGRSRLRTDLIGRRK